MEYIVGSVAALVSGNITPSRPRSLKRAATPVKHQPSPNITPKSELVDDRSIFLSPTTLKKKAIVKKSPKRIFHNPDSDVTEEKENLMSPKADKVKKHLQEELSTVGTSSKGKKLKSKSSEPDVQVELNEEAIPEKSKNRKVSDSTEITVEAIDSSATEQHPQINQETDNRKIKKKKKKSKKIANQAEILIEQDETDIVINNKSEVINTNQALDKNKKKKIKKSKTNLGLNETELVNDNSESQDLKKDSTNLDIGQSKMKKRKLKKSETNNSDSNANPAKKIKVNPNAITSKDTDSEHDSDNEIESENDEKIDEVLQNDKSASEDEEEETKSNNFKPKKISKEPMDTKEGEAVIHDPDEVNRTLFVGNVPFSKKCKKEIKKIFAVYGDIETVRIRSIPVKDPRFTPKLAVIRNELHPERSAVNVYVKYKRPESVQQALVENGRSLAEHTLRVSPCSAPSHDAARSVFVGNVPFACADDELRAVFTSSGAVASVRLVRDSQGVGKGFGYVNFESKDSVELALALTPEQRTLRNRELRVKRCALSQRDRDKQGSMRGSGRGGQGTMRGHGQRGMRGHGQSGMRGRGQDGMQGRGQGGMRGRGQGGMRGRGQGGLRGRGGTSRHEDTRTDRQGPDMQGAFRRLEHKKKKSGGGGGGGGFVGLTPDNYTKAKVKQSKQKKALAEIMSKP